MHMQKLGVDLPKVLRNIPAEVRFAGFLSDTMTLANAGWDLSIRQQIDERTYGRPELQLAMRFKTKYAEMYAITAPHPVKINDVIRAWTDGIDMIAKIGFDVIHMGPDIRFMVMPFRNAVGLFSDSFEPLRTDIYETVREEKISDFKFFKTAKPTVKDLIVDPKDVPELLDLVLKAQKPMLDKIKSRERSRENEDWLRGTLKPAHEVQAQIITLVS